MISRKLLSEAFPNQPRLVREFEAQSQTVEAVSDASAVTVMATAGMNAATVLTLSPNDAFTNEFVVSKGTGIELSVSDGLVKISTAKDVPIITGGHSATLIADGDVTLKLPQSGHIATRSGNEILTNKTLVAPKLTLISDFANDAAAATGGVVIGQMYRNGSILMIRVT